MGVKSLGGSGAASDVDAGTDAVFAEQASRFLVLYLGCSAIEVDQRQVSQDALCRLRSISTNKFTQPEALAHRKGP